MLAKGFGSRQNQMELLVSSSNKIAIIMTINKTGRLGRKSSHAYMSDKKNHRKTLPEPQLCTKAPEAILSK